MRYARAVAVLVFCLMPFDALLGQTGAGRIQGTVKDISGAVVPNAKVVALHVDTGNTFTTQSNSDGFFIFPAAQPGRYRVSAESPGMETWQGELELMTGQEAVINPVLEVGTTATRISVAGDVTQLVTTTNPTLSTVVERARIEQLPLNGRNLGSLVQLTTPGLVGSSNAPRAFGLRDGLVQFVQDGASVTDANITQLSKRPPGLDTVQEYQVVMSVPSAKYAAAVTTSFSTRSGTNQFHGSLFYTGRNNGFGVARQRQDFYTRPPQLIRNEYGASIGGPVRLPHLYKGKDRTFFFFAWEAYDLRNAATMSARLPTTAMQQGDFSQLTDGQGRPITLYDPWSTGSKAQNYVREPFVGNIIPLTRRSPLTAYYYKSMPQPNQPGVNPAMAADYFGPSPTTEDDNTYTARIDHRLSDRDQIFARFTLGNVDSLNRNAGSGSVLPMSLDKLWNATYQTERDRTGTFSWDHTFGPAFFVETVVTGGQVFWGFDIGDPLANSILSPQLGVPNPFNLPGAPSLTGLAFNQQITGSIPRYDSSMPVTGEQNFTLVRGKHEFDFGWRFQRMFLDTLPDRPGEGAISFSSLATGLYDPATGTAFGAYPRTGDDGANFFLGLAASYAQTLPAPQLNLRANQASGYFQDNWKPAQNLTLNLGLRYDYMQPLLDANGTTSAFDFANHAIVRDASLPQMIAAGATTQAIVNAYRAIGVKYETTQQTGGNLVNVGQRNFSPRLGLAYNWRLGGHSMVLRGGYGEYRVTLAPRLFTAQRSNPPLQGTVSYSINSAAKTPDGLPNYGLRSVPTAIAGTSSATNIIDPNAANAIARGVAVTMLNSNLPIPVAREWNITMETESMHGTLLRVAYVGTAGRQLDQDIMMNGQPNNYVYFATTGQPLPTGAFAPVARRDYDQTTYGDIKVLSMTGYSNYNGLEVEVQRPFRHGLAFQASYVLSNALGTGSGGQILAQTSGLPDPITFLPGSVPANFDAYNRFYNYARDIGIPQHQIKWNVLYDLPFGRGKKWLSSAGGVLNRIVGGWQLAGFSTLSSRWITLPTNNWGAVGPVQVYGTKYPIQDCRSGTCIPGYLYYNGYIPANLINSYDANGKPNGVMGVPQNYHPSSQPIWPIPANPNPSDPNYMLYGTNIVYVPMKNGTQQRVAYDTGLNPLRNQYIPGPWSWPTIDCSLFKVIPISERLFLRLNMDFFNAFNMPGTPNANANTGIVSLQTSANAPRELQWTLRLTW